MLPVGRLGGSLTLTGRDAADRLAEIVQRLAAFLAGARQQQREHLRGQQRIGQRAVAIVNGHMQGDGDAVEAARGASRQIAPGQRDGVDPFQREADIESGSAGFVAEEAEIEADIVPDDGRLSMNSCSLWQYLSGAAARLTIASLMPVNWVMNWGIARPG